MPHIEGFRRSRGHFDFGEQDAFGEGVAPGGLQGLADAPEAVNRAGEPGVRGAYHGAAGFGAPENGVRGMLTRSGAAFEPAVIGDVDEHLRSGPRGPARETAEGVLEADERRDGDAGGGEMENDRAVSGVEIGGYQIADEDGEDGETVAERDVFAEHDEVCFGIDLRFVRGAREHDGGVVVGFVAKNEAAEEQCEIAACDLRLYKMIGDGILEKPPWGGGFRPHEEVGLQGRRGFGEAFEGRVNPLLGGGIPFFLLRNGGLHGRHAYGDGFRRVLKLAQSVNKGHHDEGQREGEIKMRPDFSAARLDGEPPDRGDSDGRGKGGQKGEPAHAGEGRELKEWDVAVQGDAEGIPAEPGENVSAQVFECDPSGGGDQADLEVAPRGEPRRARRARAFARGGGHKNEAGPHGGVEGKVEAENEPSGRGHGGEPGERAEKIHEAGDIAEGGLAEEGMPRGGASKPDGGKERGQGDPGEPCLIEGGEAQDEKHAAQRGGNPGPDDGKAM